MKKLLIATMLILPLTGCFNKPVYMQGNIVIETVTKYFCVESYSIKDSWLSYTSVQGVEGLIPVSSVEVIANKKCSTIKR